MPTRRDIRRCALQCLYQFDAGGSADPGTIWSAPEPEESPTSVEAGKVGLDLATLVWEFRSDADAAVAPLTPEWPLHRQPMVDRNILRLAHYEISRGSVPPRVAISEAVELAREFGGAKSPSFVNGVLDRLFSALLRPGSDLEQGPSEPGPSVSEAEPTAGSAGESPTHRGD